MGRRIDNMRRKKDRRDKWATKTPTWYKTGRANEPKS